jgi:glycosyltransferase involved in cell wall biosynthesis
MAQFSKNKTMQYLRDAATHTPYIRRLASYLELGRAALIRLKRGPRSIAALAAHLKAARLAYPFAAGSAVDRRLAGAVRATSLQGLDWSRQFPETAEPLIRNCIILKTPTAGERGVLLITFEDQWLRMLRHADVEALARDYELVLSPTWSPPYDLAIATVAGLWPGERIFTLLSNFADEEVYARFHPKLRPVPLLASSWVDPAVFASAEAKKEFDVVMVANFSPYKRHRAFFAALAAARRQGRKLRVLLAGVPWQGRTAASLQAMADEYGVGDQIAIKVDLSDSDLRAAIRSARTAVIFSLIEGSCVAAAECLLLDVPLGMLANAHIGSKAFINQQTGRLLRPGARKAGIDLARFVDDAASFRPREWMLGHGITFKGSTKTLNAAIRSEIVRAGGAWTTDLVEHRHVRLRPRYDLPADAARFAPLYQAFPGRYRISIELNADAPVAAPEAPPIAAIQSAGLEGPL